MAVTASGGAGAEPREDADDRVGSLHDAASVQPRPVGVFGGEGGCGVDQRAAVFSVSAEPSDRAARHSIREGLLNPGQSVSDLSGTFYGAPSGASSAADHRDV